MTQERYEIGYVTLTLQTAIDICDVLEAFGLPDEFGPAPGKERVLPDGSRQTTGFVQWPMPASPTDPMPSAKYYWCRHNATREEHQRITDTLVKAGVKGWLAAPTCHPVFDTGKEVLTDASIDPVLALDGPLEEPEVRRFDIATIAKILARRTDKTAELAAIEAEEAKIIEASKPPPSLEEKYAALENRVAELEALVAKLTG